MPTRVKLLLLILIALILAVPLAFAQEETPSIIEQFALTATAMMEARTGTPTPSVMEPTLEPTEEAIVEPTEAPVIEPTEEATEATSVEPTEEATAEATETPAEAEGEAQGAEVRGIPLGVLLFGALAVLIIGAVVFLRENPRPMDDEE